MKIVIEQIKNLEETEVVIRCAEQDESVRRLEASIRLMDSKVLVKKEERAYALPPHEIYYFESVDNKVFAYTQKEVFTCQKKLYELEEELRSSSFLRVNKTTILNTSKIRHFKSLMNGRMEATLKNQEVVLISRNYVQALKMMLGGRLK